MSCAESEKIELAEIPKHSDLKQVRNLAQTIWKEEVQFMCWAGVILINSSLEFIFLYKKWLPKPEGMTPDRLILYPSKTFKEENKCWDYASLVFTFSDRPWRCPILLCGAPNRGEMSSQNIKAFSIAIWQVGWLFHPWLFIYFDLFSCGMNWLK